MSRRTLAALAACAVVLLAAALVAGLRAPGPSASPSLDAERLGPDPGRSVAEYLAGLPARLPAPDAGPVPALVQLSAPADPAGAAALVAGARPVTAVFRVPLPRVQTALRFQPLPPVDGADPVAATARRLDLARAAAQRAAGADAARLSGRPARVAAAEAAALADPGCRCVLALQVAADRAGLVTLAGRPGVRAVDAAPAGTPDDGVALAPLLPEQVRTAGPVPDDGPLPP